MVFWDACAIIYVVEGVSLWADRVVETVQRIDDGRGGHAASQLSLLECRIKPLREQDAVILARYERFFSRRDLIEVSLTREIVLEAARIRAVSNLNTPDALQAATALSLAKPVTFLTNDRVFERVAGLNVALLD